MFSQLRTKYKTTMWYLETGLYLCIQDCIYGFEGRVMAGLWDIYLPALCATWSAATQKELCDPLSSGDISSDSTCLFVSTEGIRGQQYSRLLHTTLLMSNVMLDKMTSEVTSLWTVSQIEKQTQSACFNLIQQRK